MERKAYLARWRLDPDPFQDEEAKNDAVFAELIDNYDVHPHFGKVYGNPEKPGPAVVFGPKGSGKTALRLQIEHRLREHNQAELAASAGRPGGAEGARRVRVVAYDDLNPFLDCFKSRVGGRRSSDDEVLDRLSLADHMDAILSLAVTELVSEAIDRKSDVAQGVRRLGKEQRTTLALLALFYDHPTGDDPARRWGRLWSAIRPVWLPAASVAKGLGAALLGLAVLGAIARFFKPGLSELSVYAVGALGLALLGVYAAKRIGAWLAARRIRAGLRTVDRRGATLAAGLTALPASALHSIPLPSDAGEETRYALLRLLVGILEPLGYGSLLVLVDRVDEPTLVSSKTDRMRKVVWPMLDLKFLQQNRIAIKMLLPAELNLLAEREGPDFKQRARLDKSNRIDLDWGGSALYDLCTQRMRVCHAPEEGGGRIELKDLFEGIARDELVTALGSLVHPRNALKFMYDLIDAQCEKADRDGVLIPRHRLEAHLERAVRSIRADLLMGNPT